ncbi:hypothetical protein [Mannheimia granulomatis]|uniref:hypothetical protein n=1 Tax=Mannheimia granulomatis TaxID=85402 RepID=UPI000A83BB8F|nr:hypothetical protein [Mannheimia granulomatis]
MRQNWDFEMWFSGFPVDNTLLFAENQIEAVKPNVPKPLPPKFWMHFWQSQLSD